MFTRFEIDAINFILAGDDPVLKELRKHFSIAAVESREFTGYGFLLNFKLPPDTPKLTDMFDIRPNFDITDVSVTFPPDKHLYKLALFIQGRLLEFSRRFPVGGSGLA